MNLSEKQSKELEHIVSKIDSEFKDDLNEVLNENPKTRTQLRQIWKKDRLDRHCEDIMTFKNDQKKYGNFVNGSNSIEFQEY